jgi:hypothetical protein
LDISTWLCAPRSGAIPAGEHETRSPSCGRLPCNADNAAGALRKIEEWFDLSSDDVLYFMPRRKNVPRRELHRELTPLGDLAILEVDRRYLEMRVRLDTGMAWAGDPPSRTRHPDRQSAGGAAGERRGAG